MASIVARIYSVLVKAGKRAASATGLRRTRIGRNLITLLNVGGAAIMGTLVPSDNRPIEVYGHRMVMGPKSQLTVVMTSAVMSGQYEVATTRLFEKLLLPGMTILDVGANIGYYSLVAAKLVGGQGRVYAFEPDPRNCDVLRQNIELNGYKTIEVVQCAVADKPGTIRLFLSAQGTDKNSIAPTSGDVFKDSAIEVPTVTLDEFVRSKGRPKVDFIKMDIEGAELLAVRGMRELVRNSKNLKIVMEFNPERLAACGFGPRDLLEGLRDIDLEINCVEDDSQLTKLGPDQFDSFVASFVGKTPKNLLCTRVASTSTASP